MLRIINIEGNDGTGKRTVTDALATELESRGHAVKKLDFPCYNTETGKVVKDFLNGMLFYEDPCKVTPYLASLPYTMDRLAFFEQMSDFFQFDGFVISNRSYLANMFYQGAKYFQFVDLDKPCLGDTPNGSNAAADFYRWVRTQIYLEIGASPLGKLKDGNYSVVNFYLEAESIEENHNKMLKRGESLDLHEQNQAYLRLVEACAQAQIYAKAIDHLKYGILNDLAIIDERVTKKTLSNFDKFYRYYIIPTLNGSTPEEIERFSNHTIRQILVYLRNHNMNI